MKMVHIRPNGLMTSEQFKDFDKHLSTVLESYHLSNGYQYLFPDDIPEEIGNLLNEAVTVWNYETNETSGEALSRSVKELPNGKFRDEYYSVQ